jgi:hypothetical protein
MKMLNFVLFILDIVSGEYLAPEGYKTLKQARERAEKLSYESKAVWIDDKAGNNRAYFKPVNQYHTTGREATLAEKIINTIYGNKASWNTLYKMRIDVTAPEYKEERERYGMKESVILCMCREEIRQQALKTNFTADKVKRIREVEKFLKNHVDESRPMFKTVYHDEQDKTRVYTNCHMLTVAPAADLEGIGKQWTFEHFAEQAGDVSRYVDYKSVIPNIEHAEQVTINANEIIAAEKAAKAATNRNDDGRYISVVQFDTFKAGYNVEYLAHIVRVMQAKKIVLFANKSLQPCKIINRENDIYAVVSPVRLGENAEVNSRQYLKTA